MDKRQIRIFYFDGCPNGEGAYELVQSVLREYGCDADVTLVEVTGPEQAESLRFLGSPTIQVDGIDVEPSRRDDRGFAFACRVYEHSDSRSGLPPREMVAAALGCSLSDI